jgi:hyperosmotically inducible periplasmic protein
MDKMKNLKTNLIAVVTTLLIGIAPQTLLANTANAAATGPAGMVANDTPTNARLLKQVRHKLLMLPYYGVFDHLAYSIDGGKVTLLGQVVRPSTRSDAARSVAQIKGVTQVVNKIEVLPLSNFDNSLRVRTYQALARTSGLQRYLAGSNPSLHIVVSRGQITLAGMVGNKMDKQLAYMAARGVSGAFSVTNNVQIESDGDVG